MDLDKLIESCVVEHNSDKYIDNIKAKLSEDNIKKLTDCNYISDLTTIKIGDYIRYIDNKCKKVSGKCKVIGLITKKTRTINLLHRLKLQLIIPCGHKMCGKFIKPNGKLYMCDKMRIYNFQLNPRKFHIFKTVIKRHTKASRFADMIRKLHDSITNDET